MNGISFTAEQCADQLKSLAEPNRLRIIGVLRGGEKTVGQLADALGSEAVVVSHHLQVLYNARFVQRKKQGRFVCYSLHPDAFPAASSRDENMYVDLGCCMLQFPGNPPN